jgi:predicted MFS family arabinose efflux permease
VDVSTLAAILLTVGAAGLLGTYVIGLLLASDRPDWNQSGRESAGQRYADPNRPEHSQDDLGLRTRLYSLLVAIPLAMAAIALALIALGQSPAIVAVLLAGWGLIGTAAPVGWWTWLSKVLPDDAEAGGGLMVAVVQLAITAGASAGGVLFDTRGFQSTFGLSAAVLCTSALLAFFGSRATRRAPF